MIPRTAKNCEPKSTKNITSPVSSEHLGDPLQAANHPASLLASSNNTWQHTLSQSSISLTALLEQLALSFDDMDQRYAAHRDFLLKVPAPYLNKIEKGNANDPLLKQILPAAQEMVYQPGFNKDPLEEKQAIPTPGIIHKYHGRALFIVTQTCAIHCRYCFRRHFDYRENTLAKKDIEQALTYLKDHKDINEIILSGGDPLAINNRHFAWLLEQLSDIGHIKRLRIHSRLPIVLPARIDQALLNALDQWRGQKVMVVHANHANELGPDVAKAIAHLQAIGVTTLNQSVLLKGINDCPQALTALSEALFEMGVLPYYLHQLDKVQGAAHFLVSDEKAKALIQSVSHQLPGFLVPRLAREEPGKLAKTLLPVSN